MGTELVVFAAAPTRAAALDASEAAVAAVAAAEQRLSTWLSDSELSRLNGAAVGVDVALSPELAQDLADCLRWSRESGGAFDAGCGALAAAWGLRTGGAVPDDAALEAARSDTGLGAALALGNGTARWLRPGTSVDAGGFGKGVALDAAATAMRAVGAVGWISLGGQVTAVDAPVELAVAHPRERAKAIVHLSLGGGSAATSGNSERGLEAQGRRYGHILDPRTGLPAADFGSVTVWRQRAADADACSTAAFVMGPERALRWAATQSNCELLIASIRVGRVEVIATPGLRGRLRAAAPGISILFHDPTAGAAAPNPHSQGPKP